MKNMLLTSLILLLISNAVTSNKDKSILYSRAVISSLLFAIFLLIASFNATPLIKGIPVYGALFNITITTVALNILIYIFAIVVIVRIVFFNASIKRMSYILFVYAIVTVNLRLLSFMIITNFNLLLLAAIFTSLSVVMIVAVGFGLKGETRSSTFYWSLFKTTYVMNTFFMWVQSMVGGTVDPFHIYPFLFILGLKELELPDNFIMINCLNKAPWDGDPNNGVYKAVESYVNGKSPTATRIKGNIGVSLHPLYTHCTNFNGKSVVVAYNDPRIDHLDFNYLSVCPWRLSPQEMLPRDASPITWFWGNRRNAIVYPYNPRLDPNTYVFNLLKNDQLARKEYFLLKEQAMIRYSHLNMEETHTNLWLLNKQKSWYNPYDKPKL